MFASFFRKSQPIRTIGSRSSRSPLAIENLEDRTVPSTVMSDLGAAGDGVHLLAGPASGGIEWRSGQAAVSANISLLGALPGGVTADAARAGNEVNVLGALPGGVTADTARAGNDVSLLGALPGGVTADAARAGNEVNVLGALPGGVTADAAAAHASAFADLDADGAGEIDLFYTPRLGHLEELPQ